MSVRLRKWTDRSGREQAAWLVDVVFEHANGRVQRVKKVSPVNTRRGAEQYERDLRAALAAGTYGKVENVCPTLEEFKPRFLVHAETNNKYSSKVSKETLLKHHLVPAFGETRLDEITPFAIEQLKAAKLRDGFAPQTVNNILGVLRKLLNLAVEWGELRSAPKVKSLRRPQSDFDFLQFDEADRLLAAMSGEWRTMVLLGLNTGLRQGELLALRWDAVDLVAGRPVVKRSAWRGVEGTPKSGKPREIPLNRRTIAALKSHRHLRGEYVFCFEDGRPLGQAVCKAPLRRACKSAGLRPVGWHVLRHTFASHLVTLGVSLKAVQELLGHATVEMTMRYAHLSPNVKRDAVAALEAPATQTAATAAS